MDLTLFGKRQAIIELCQQIETCLIDNNRLLLPSCYFRADLFSAEQAATLLPQLQQIVTKHRGRVVDSPDDADHIIFPASSEESPDAGNGGNPWVRVVKRRPKEAMLLVHRYFTPDSHDEWLNGIDLDEDAAASLNESSQSAGGSDVYEVTANWLLDTDLYNEWMNQEDYEVDTEQMSADGAAKTIRLKKPPKSRRTLSDVLKYQKTGSGDDKRSPSPAPPVNKKMKSSTTTPTTGSTTRNKRKHEEMKEAAAAAAASSNHNNHDLTEGMEAPPAQPHVEEVANTGGRTVKKEATQQQADVVQPYRNGTLIDLDEDANEKAHEENKDPNLVNGKGGGLNGHGGSGAVPFTNNTNTQGVVSQVNGLGEPESCEQTHHIIIPSYSSWFDYSSIHELEKRALPEFFNAKNRSKTPEIYLGYRNFMIDTYRLNPSEYLSATSCRRNLPGDVCAIMRVHAFLEQWGLINYQVDYEARAAPLGPPCTSHFTVVADTPSGLAPITGPRPTTAATVSQASSASASAKMIEFKSATSTSATGAAPAAAADAKTRKDDQSSAPVAVEKLSAENFGLQTKVFFLLLDKQHFTVSTYHQHNVF